MMSSINWNIKCGRLGFLISNIGYEPAFSTSLRVKALSRFGSQREERGSARVILLVFR